MVVASTAGFEAIAPGFRSLAFPHGHVETLHTGCRWVEGPAWFAAGRHLVWSDVPNDRMLRCDDTDGSVSVFRTPAQNTNGHTVDLQSRLVSCKHCSRCISRTEHDGSRTVLASHFEGKRVNSPNDAIVKSDGSIRFTGPGYCIDSDSDSDCEGDAQPGEIGARHRGRRSCRRRPRISPLDRRRHQRPVVRAAARLSRAVPDRHDARDAWQCPTWLAPHHAWLEAAR